MTTQITSTTVRPSHCSVQSGTAMNLSKTLQVQDQIIEQLRADQAALREALEAERSTLRDCRLTSDRELKALQREKLQVYKQNKQQEVKIEELEKELAYMKEALAYEQKTLKSLEKEHVATVKDLKLKMSKDFEKINKQEMLIDQLKSEVEDLKDALTSERNATNLLIREHNAEVKMLREEVKSKSTEAYRELKERATREREEYREMQEEAEKTYRVLEKDFRETLAAKDEELKRVKAEAKLIQKELEDQLRNCLKEPNPVSTPPPLETNDFVEMAKFRRLKNEMAILREQNRKLLNEIQKAYAAHTRQHEKVMEQYVGELKSSMLNVKMALPEMTTAAMLLALYNLKILTGESKANEVSGAENYIIPYNVPPQNLDGKTKAGEKGKKSVTSVPDKCPDFEITRLPSDCSMSKNIAKRHTKSTMSMRREEAYRPYPKTKTEERYEELKRTMMILRKALQ